MHTILIADDEESIRKMYSTLFANHGYRVLTAQNGNDAVSVAMSDHPDAILLDVMMPFTDGLTALKKIRQDTWGATVPVLLLTNVDPGNDELSVIESEHPAYYLIKSNTPPEEVLSKVRDILDPAPSKEDTHGQNTAG